MILLLALIISGCAAERISLPDFDQAARLPGEVVSPVEYPPLCEIPWNSAVCWQALDVFEDVAHGNMELANLNASIARDSEQAYDHILSAGKQQQQIALIREEMLEAERRDHFIDNLWHRGLIILIGVGLAL